MNGDIPPLDEYRRIRERDPHAMEQFCALTRCRVRQVLRQAGVGRCDLDDLTNQVHFIAWSAIRDGVDPLRLLPWISTITRRVSHRFRSQQAVHRDRISLHLSVDSLRGRPLSSPIEQNELLESLLGSLPLAVRSTIVLKYVCEMSRNEIAARLQIDTFEVDRRLRYGRMKLIESYSARLMNPLPESDPG